MTSLVGRLVNTARIAARSRIERRIPYWPPARIERLQRRRLRSIARHAFRTVPFYRAAMQERGLGPDDFHTSADLARLPLIDGALVRSAVERFTSSRFDDMSRVAMKTGGSAHAGVRSVIYWDPASQLLKLAIAERDRAVVSRMLGREWGVRQLIVLPEASVSLEIRAWWDARVVTPPTLATRHVIPAERPYDEVADRIEETRPDVVYSYGSYADLFFRKLAIGGRRLSAPRLWIYGGDMLPAEGRERIERDFDIPVLSTYQTVETGRLGFECEARRGFHLNVDLCALRLIDGSGQDVVAGETGEVVVSNLYNRAMVLLNYRLGDRGVLSTEPCSCGRRLPILEELEGRVTDVLRLADGSEIPSLVLRNLVRTELAFAFQCQIVHPGPGRIVWRIVPLPGHDRQAAGRVLVERTREHLGEGMDVSLEFVDRISPTAGGKHLGLVGPGA